MTDPIADMIIRIKNALLARHSEVRIPYSRMKDSLAQILVREGYIQTVTTVQETQFKELLVTLKYNGRLPVVNDVKRLSSPGRRLYAPAKQIPKALGGYGITVISTSRGIMTDKEARKQNIGGELLFQIW